MPDLHIREGHRQRDALLFPRHQPDLLKSKQLPVCLVEPEPHLLPIKLDDLFPFYPAAVAHGHGEFQGVVRAEGGPAPFAVRILEAGVAQAVAEGKQRLTQPILISPAHLVRRIQRADPVVGDMGKLFVAVVPGLAAPPGRADLAEEDLSDGCALAFARINRPKDGGDLRKELPGHGAGGDEDHRDIGVDRLKLPDLFVLVIGQRQGSPVPPFAGHAGVRSGHDDHRVGLFCCMKGFFPQVFPALIQVRIVHRMTGNGRRQLGPLCTAGSQLAVELLDRFRRAGVEIFIHAQPVFLRGPFQHREAVPALDGLVQDMPAFGIRHGESQAFPDLPDARQRRHGDAGIGIAANGIASQLPVDGVGADHKKILCIFFPQGQEIIFVAQQGHGGFRRFQSGGCMSFAA